MAVSDECVGTPMPYINPLARNWRTPAPVKSDNIIKFHQNLPGYEESPLISLDAVATELGVKKVYLKYEGARLGLKAFKILGASWAIAQAIAEHLGLDSTDINLDTVKERIKATEITIYTASQGNHGMAVAKMSRLLGVKARVYLPGDASDEVESNLKGLGAEVIRCEDKDYDEAVLQAEQDATHDGSILIQDTSWEGYEQVPAWIVDGYSTIMTEINRQLVGEELSLVVTPVGVGSLAHAVVRHCKSISPLAARVLTVEPEGAACLNHSLSRARLEPVKTATSIMAGMNCGTVSFTAWDTLRHGVDASVTLSDPEVEQSLLHLRTLGVEAGPCGGAALAGLLKTASQLELGSNSVVVLICTEGARKY